MVLQTFNLSKRFGNRWAVKNLNLSVEKGQIFGFLGPNGAGKSTTIRMLLNLIRPTNGSFELLSKNIKNHGQKIYSNIGALVEKPDFYLYLSAEKNLRILGSLGGEMSPDRINEVLEIVKLVDRAKDKVRNFSHGMNQRLGIAQALLSYPELIILDEPTSGLDPQGIKEIRELIVTLAQEHEITVFLSSHLLHEIEQTCTHMAIIDNGALVVQGGVEKLLRETDFYVTEVIVDQPERACDLLKIERWIKKVSIAENVIKVQIMEKERPRLTEFLVRNHFAVYSVVPRTSLEDYYLSLLKKKEAE
ncbi:MAG: ABC transporter ATP-binding protein [Candidatus Marinimicrobia bacterium]|nr:ABC transporter ATP-binding protein [Candidatus Neomarinimicrobiota bacterium]